MLWPINFIEVRLYLYIVIVDYYDLQVVQNVIHVMAKIVFINMGTFVYMIAIEVVVE